MNLYKKLSRFQVRKLPANLITIKLPILSIVTNFCSAFGLYVDGEIYYSFFLGIHVATKFYQILADWAELGRICW